MAIRNGPLWDKVLKIAVCLGLFLAFWGVQWVIPDFYQELFRLSLAGDVDGLRPFSGNSCRQGTAGRHRSPLGP